MPVCRWCRAPIETVEVSYHPGVFVVEDCIRPACVQARQQELGRRRVAQTLSRHRPPGRVVRCLPGLCEAGGGIPPGEPPRCRHCEAEVIR